MLINNEAVLRKHLNAPPASCYYVYGENSYLVRHYAAKLAERATGGDMSEWVLQKFDFSRSTIDDAITAAFAVSFTGGSKCIFFPSFKASELSAEDNQKLLDLIPDVPEGVTLVIEGLEPPKKQGKRSMFSEMDKYGVLVELSAHERNDLVKFCQRIAAQNKATIKTATCDYLFQRTTDNMEQLANEMEKLSAYVGPNEILPEHIDRLCTVRLDQSVFDISKAIIRQDLTTAFARLDSLRTRREEPIAILGALSSTFLDLYRFKLSDYRRIPVSTLANDFGYRGSNDYRLSRASADSQRLTLTYLRNCISILTETDLNCKLLKVNKFELLEQMTVRLIDARRTSR